MYYLCVSEREDMHAVRTLSFVLLSINNLESPLMYI